MSAPASWARLFCGLAALFALLTYVGPADLAEQVRIEAVEKETRPLRREQAELLCQCLKVKAGKWLRVQVTHQPDKEFCRAVCFYEGGTVTRGTL
jgi:hypothetical protein